MKWLFRAVVGLVIAILVGAIGLLAFFVVDKTMVNNYRVHLSLSMDAAALSGDGITVREGDEWHRLDEESDRKLRYYLTCSPLMAVDWFCKGNEVIELRLSGDPLWIWRLDDDTCIVRLESSVGNYCMRVKCDQIWAWVTRYTGVKNYYTETNA